MIQNNSNLITAEELLAMPDDNQRSELIRGVLDVCGNWQLAVDEVFVD